VVQSRSPARDEPACRPDSRLPGLRAVHTTTPEPPRPQDLCHIGAGRAKKRNISRVAAHGPSQTECEKRSRRGPQTPAQVARRHHPRSLPADPKRRGPSENGLEHGNGFEQGQNSGDGLGRQKTPPGLTRPRLETESTTYLWDGLRVLAEYTDKGAPLAEYYTAGDRVLARKMFGYHGRKEPGAPDLQTNGGLLYYTYDGLGNVSLLTDRLGESEASYRYDAFGGLLTSATAPYNLYGPFGKEFDPASGLIYFGARWYDASVGRFTTPDPAPGALRDPLTLNPYLFAKANPVNFVDRWGLHAEEPASTYTHDVTADYREVTATTWLASVEVSYTSEVSRSPREVVLHHVYRHRHLYQRIELRSERRVRPDGYEYWELVKDIEYTYWKTIESSDEWETIDLIGPKQTELEDTAGTARPSYEHWLNASMAMELNPDFGVGSGEASPTRGGEGSGSSAGQGLDDFTAILAIGALISQADTILLGPADVAALLYVIAAGVHIASERLADLLPLVLEAVRNRQIEGLTKSAAQHLANLLGQSVAGRPPEDKKNRTTEKWIKEIKARLREVSRKAGGGLQQVAAVGVNKGLANHRVTQTRARRDGSGVD